MMIFNGAGSAYAECAYTGYLVRDNSGRVAAIHERNHVKRIEYVYGSTGAIAKRIDYLNPITMLPSYTETFFNGFGGPDKAYDQNGKLIKEYIYEEHGWLEKIYEYRDVITEEPSAIRITDASLYQANETYYLKADRETDAAGNLTREYFYEDGEIARVKTHVTDPATGKPVLYSITTTEWVEAECGWTTKTTLADTGNVVPSPVPEPQDTIGPTTNISTPIVSTNLSKTSKFKVSWSASDPGFSSGIDTFDVEYRPSHSSTWRRWTNKTTARSALFSGAVGKTYYFRARAKDKAGNVGSWSNKKLTIIPYDQNSLIVQRRGFENMVKNYKSQLYLGTARYSRTANDFLRIKFYGNSVRLSGPKGPGISRAKLYIDGSYYKTIDPYASTSSFRKVLFIKTFAKRGTHTIKIVNVGNRSRFSLDAVAAGLAPPDRSSPSTILTAPPLSTKQSKTPNFKVFWTAKDRWPSSGVASFDVKYRESGTKTWKMWKKGTTGRSAVFKGTIGKTYYFQARAKDHAGNTGRWSAGKRTIVPYDQNSLINTKFGFGKTYSKASSKLYLGTMRYSTAPKTYVKYRFWGNKVFLVGPRTPQTSRFRIFVDGKYQGTFDRYSSRPKHRQVLYGKAFSGSRTHTIKIVNVGDRSRLSLDAIAVQR